jgi:hypothetical protein
MTQKELQKYLRESNRMCRAANAPGSIEHSVLETKRRPDNPQSEGAGWSCYQSYAEASHSRLTRRAQPTRWLRLLAFYLKKETNCL